MTTPRHGVVVLATGVALFALIWWLGAPQWGWIGFVVAALVGWTMNLPAAKTFRPPVSDRLPDRAQLPAPGQYVLDPATSVVRFRVRKLGIPVTGTFHQATGAVTVVRDLSQSAVVAVVPATTVHTANSARDRHLKSANFLDTEKHPFMRFTSTQVTAAEHTHRIVGHLTVRGESHQITLDVRSHPTADGATRHRIHAQGTVRRSWFGITAMSWLVADQVTISIEAEACRR